jgi:predicted transcriptional regulator
MALTRISLTIPSGVVRKLDRTAKSLHRSRSWVIVEAVKQYLAGEPGPARTVTKSASDRAAESGQLPYVAGLGEHRLQQLEADLRLSPTERVRSAQKTLKQARGRRAFTLHRVVQFDRYEDYINWERSEQLVR